MEGAVLNQDVFDPNNRIADSAFCDAEIEGKVSHRPIFPPVLQCQQQLIALREFGASSSFAMPFSSGGSEKGKHATKRVLFDSEEFFELSVAYGQGFLYAFGLDLLRNPEICILMGLQRVL